MLRITGVRNELLDGFLLKDRRVEPLTGTVRADNGAETHLTSKSVEVLLCLARKPRKLVAREEILERVWGSANASPERLSHAISEIRHAVGDHTDHPEFIQTVPKRGYRLLVEPQISPLETVHSPGAGKPERKTLVGNLMDRGVIQASAAFLVVGWLLIQVADAVVPILGLPAWTTKFTTYVVIGGFPVVVVLAWFFEYAEGRFYLDRGKDSPTVTTGLGKNYLTMVAAYAITAAGALVYQYTVGFNVVDNALTAPVEITKSPIRVEPNSIAVLRFMNIDGSEKSEIFSHGFAEDVLDRLAKIPGLLVSARGDSWSLPVNAASDEVRHRLRVAYYLEGSVRLVGDDLRVVAQLIDSETGFHVVSRVFDKKLEDFMEVQDEITDLTVANLRVALPEDTQMILASNYQGTDVDAYVLYRQGKEILDAPLTKESLENATAYFERALQIDPEYAAAHAGLCTVYTYGFEVSGDESLIVSAETACAAGLAANSNLHMVYTALGELYTQTGRYSEAEVAYLQAIAISGQDVDAMQGLALIYERQQRFDEAMNMLDEAIRLQPGNWRSIDTLGGLLFANGRYVEAADAYQEIAMLDPDNHHALGNLGSALLMTGDFSGAANALQQSLEIEPDRGVYSNLAIIFYYQGRFDESVEIHRTAVADSPDRNYVWLNLGDALLFSSEPEKAQQAFERSADLAERVLAVNPRSADTMYELAWAKAMLGDTSGARKLLDQSMSLDPENPYVHYYDALLKHHVGDDAAAVEAAGNAVDLGYPRVLLAAEPYLRGLQASPDFVTLVSGDN